MVKVVSTLTVVSTFFLVTVTLAGPPAAGAAAGAGAGAAAGAAAGAGAAGAAGAAAGAAAGVGAAAGAAAGACPVTSIYGLYLEVLQKRRWLKQAFIIINPCSKYLPIVTLSK